MNHIVVDLEMCKVNKRHHAEFAYGTETIQIGAVMLDEEFEEISSFSVYVKPQFGQIDWVISNLTGITEANVKNAPSIEEALKMFAVWVGDREVTYYAWSENDYEQLLHEVLLKNINDADCMDLMDASWLDYQRTFDERYQLPLHTALKQALDLCDITMEGRAHDGLWDARNTGRLIALLEKDAEYRIPEEYISAKNGRESETLSYSMGSLFEGLKLA